MKRAMRKAFSQKRMNTRRVPYDTFKTNNNNHMKIIYLIVLLGFILNAEVSKAQSAKQRLIVLADMGHDPDEEQQMTHLLMCSNEFDLEGLVAVTGRFFRKNPTDTVKILMPELFHRLIDGYAQVYPNLQLHAGGYKRAEYLHSIVASGQRGNGMKDVGAGRTSEGAKLIINAVVKDDSRPVYVVINSGANTLAQALYYYRENHTAKELNDFIKKLIVFDNGGQDESGAWICHNFPELFYIRSTIQTHSFGGPRNNNLGPHCWQPYAYSPEGQHNWAKEHIQTNHGALGKLYPNRYVGKFHFLEGGGTIPWIGLVTRGLSDISHPWWGGWSGRYSREELANVPSGHAIVQPDELKYQPYAAYTDMEGIVDKWTNPFDNTVYENEYVPVWRWRQAMWNDLRCRMDWCIEPFENANHPPVVLINGFKEAAIKIMNVQAGEIIHLDASESSDPDNDVLSFNWWIYKEAGTYDEDLSVSDGESSKVSLKIPNNAKGKEIHLILEVKDNNKIASMYDYRRIVFFVE